ncbi:MAG: aminotransferase class I/II-fold pyridoxal phosphate-dependent enzyme [Saprospirales bacterium]|nr:MAG: aminotransferase class I/II-fold pyridoxal phosphate-dependent enzyme [Saprospirales bacterium]
MNKSTVFEKKYRTVCAREWPGKDSTGTHILPLHQSNSFESPTMEEAIDVFTGRESGFIYTRYGNPTVNAVAEKLAFLEGLKSGAKCHAILTSSGMSAISTLCYSLLNSGDEMIIHPSLYGGSLELFASEIQRAGIRVHQMDLRDTERLESQLKSCSINASAIFFETPTNPGLEILEIENICAVASRYGLKTIVDNTFCTSYLQRPLDLGADFTVYSTSKFINGHGNSMGGLIVSRDEEVMRKKVWKTMKLLGTNISPFEAWLINQGLKTLPLRMESQYRNAMKVAEALQGFDWVAKVNYPGLKSNPYHEAAKRQMDNFGSMLSLELYADFSTTIKFCNQLSFSKSPTLGDPDTLLLHPATSSHINVDAKVREETGITDSLVRLSIGLEDSGDLIAELDIAGKSL